MEQTFLICLENKLALSELPETLGGMWYIDINFECEYLI